MMDNLQELIALIGETQHYFKHQAQRQVNTALTLRNWLFGFYIVEYEQNGADRAKYGDKLIERLSKELGKKQLKGFSPISLRMCRQFYVTYPQIQQSLAVELYLKGFQGVEILQSVTAKLLSAENSDSKSTNISLSPIFQSVSGKSQIDVDRLINQLSFTHIIELLKADTPLKRSFYEVEAVSNSWSVRELQRAMNSMLFERTGLSTNKEAVLEKHIRQERLLPEDIFRNPYMLEFLGLSEKIEYSESDLEQAIITHLQTFLLEMGKGFCFEARQKRITFGNTHYRIDLVFYHRILKCHVLVDLKLGEFDHADAGQMNVYLNYYQENEMSEGDNPPVGLILCASKNAQLVKYATAGMAQQLFVSQYLIHLPSEAELTQFIQNEQLA